MKRKELIMNVILILACFIGDVHGRRAAGEGGVDHPDPYPVSSGGKHELHRRCHLVRRAAGSPPGGPPERAGLGVRPGRCRLLAAAAGRALLRAQHAPVARLLRLQHLLPAERQFRHRLQLRRRWNHHQQGPKFRAMQVPGI
uniref:Uncharacterized protein n=1 Tax=Aegilops tauschii subsp. strangulata TaxID=200361 RepID=A0A453BN15_AEGTS